MVCEIPFEIKIKEESEAFLRVLSEQDIGEDVLTMQFCMVNAFPEMGEKFHQESSQCYVEMKDEWRIYHCPSPGTAPYACTIWNRQNQKRVQCQYLENKEKYLEFSRNVIYHLGLETLLRVNEGLLLHASLIRWEEKGILFTAPSGTGKSTQAELWKQYEEAEILNGDRAALRKVDDTWFAYGLPYAGTSGIYKNENVKIAAIVVLRQAKENKIRSLTPGEAFLHLYPELTIHRWDREFIEEIWERITCLLEEVPIYLLECMPDSGAVALVKEKMEKERS